MHQYLSSLYHVLVLHHLQTNKPVIVITITVCPLAITSIINVLRIIMKNLIAKINTNLVFKAAVILEIVACPNSH